MTASVPLRITASAARWSMGLAFGVATAAIVALGAGSIGAIQALLDPTIARTATGAVVVVCLVAYTVFLGFAMTPLALTIDVWADRVALDDGDAGRPDPWDPCAHARHPGLPLLVAG